MKDDDRQRKAVFPALAALQVRDMVALGLLMTCHDMLITSSTSSPRDVIRTAFALADEFAIQSEGRWALDAKAAKRKREQ